MLNLLIKELAVIERSEYKGHPMIILKRDNDEKFPFSFGLTKAKLILENIEEIKKFVRELEGGKGSDKTDAVQ